MDIDDKNPSETSNDSSSEPEEISNKDAKDLAVTSIKAEFASQRSLKEKAKKLRRKIELRNIEQKKIKEEKQKAVDDSDPPKPEKSVINDKANVPPEAEQAKSEKPERSLKSKKNIKSTKNLENSNDKPGSSTGQKQADSKSDSNDKGEPKKLTGNARKKARKRFNKAGTLGKVFKKKLVKNSVKVEKNIQNFKKLNSKATNLKTDAVKDNNSVEKAQGKKRKFKEKNKIPEIKPKKKFTVKTEPTN